MASIQQPCREACGAGNRCASELCFQQALDIQIKLKNPVGTVYSALRDFVIKLFTISS
jgi:hypothetical protein